MLAKRGRLLALAAVDARSGEVVGGGTLHHLDSEREIVEIGYFVLPHARKRLDFHLLDARKAQRSMLRGKRSTVCVT